MGEPWVADHLLIDARQLLYRAVWRACRSGEPSGAPDAFARLLDSLVASHVRSAVDVVVCWEGGEGHRHRLYPGYKSARRLREPDEVALALPPQERATQAALHAAGWDQVSSPGFEADDVMATLSQQLRGTVGIVTRDRDLYQVVSGRVRVLSMAPAGADVEVIGPRAVRTRYGVTPDQLTSWKAIVGDKSDSIPGVAGLGAKAATRLVQAHGTLDAVLDLAPTVKAFEGSDPCGKAWRSPSYARKLADPVNRELARVSWALSTLVYCPVKPLFSG